MDMYYAVSLHSNTSQNVGFLAHNKVSCFCSVPNLFFVIYAFSWYIQHYPALFLSYSYPFLALFLSSSFPVSYLFPNLSLSPPILSLSCSYPVRILFLSFYSPVPFFLLSCSSLVPVFFLSFPSRHTLMSLSSSSVLLLFLSYSHVSPVLILFRLDPLLFVSLSCFVPILFLSYSYLVLLPFLSCCWPRHSCPFYFLCFFFPFLFKSDLLFHYNSSFLLCLYFSVIWGMGQPLIEVPLTRVVGEGLECCYSIAALCGWLVCAQVPWVVNLSGDNNDPVSMYFGFSL